MELPLHPYRKFWPQTKEYNESTFDKFIYGWQGASRDTYDDYLYPKPEPGVCPYLYTKTPEDCNFEPWHIPLGYPYSRFFVHEPFKGLHRTCWDIQGDLLQGAFCRFSSGLL